MHKLRLFKYFCLFVMVTAIFGSIDLAMQQNYRQSANDPQIQIAEDGAAALSAGIMPQWNASTQIDAGRSLAPFVVIYSATGTPIAASGLINGAMPTIPSGIFASVKAHGEDRVTWQTPTSLRFAAVITSYKNGYVMAARSLREIEIREDKLNRQVGLPYAVSVVLMLVYCVWKWKETRKA
ncbi:MAG: hypothetical protein P4L61_01285 [Candidatus Pacebacteria bacterium]|nr:hypothetical protein [Candidatus Paceibacterota bacterium]